MRMMTWAMIAALAVRPWTMPGEGAQTPPQNERQSSNKILDVTAARTNPSHVHADGKTPGTPPCGRAGAPCGNRDKGLDSPRESHTGRDVAIGVGVAALAGLVIAGSAAGQESKPFNTLSNQGPQFPEVLHMSEFQVTGFAKGGWPVVVDYEAEAGTYAALTIVAQGSSPVAVVLAVPETGRRLVILQLPGTLGSDLKIADFTIRATANQNSRQPRYFRVYGFGCGSRAVGSVGIDELRFGPRTISREQAETRFSFHAHSTFDKMRAEFMQIALVDNCAEGRVFDNKKIDRRVQEDDSVQDNWDAKKAGAGQIQFRVRGWMTASGGGDWVSAFSPELVLKQ